MMPLLNQIVSRYRSNFTKGSFGHNVLVMFTGTAMGQLASVLLSPVLTRLYTPDMFGVLGIFTATLGITAVIAAMRYEMALPLTQSNEDAANLLAVCMTALVITTAAACLLLLWLPFDLQSLMPYRWMLPVGFFCVGAYQTMIYYATREGAFPIIARTKVHQGITGPALQIVLGILNAGPWGLIIGFIAGQSTGSSLLFSRLVLARRALHNVTTKGMRAMAARFYHFPLISSWSGLMEAAGGFHLLLVAVPLIYSNTIAGFIFLCDRIIVRPLLLISTSILQVYVGDMSRVANADPAALRLRFLQLAKHQFLIVSVWLLVVNVTAPFLFPILFGSKWQAAVPYLHVLSIAYLPQMVIHALLHTLQILERQALSAVWEVTRLIAVLGAFAVAYTMQMDALDAVLMYSVVQAIAQLVLFMLMYRSIESLQTRPEHA